MGSRKQQSGQSAAEYSTGMRKMATEHLCGHVMLRPWASQFSCKEIFISKCYQLHCNDKFEVAVGNLSASTLAVNFLARTAGFARVLL